jgi:hypothetical protein
MGTERRRHPRVPSRQRCWCEGNDITIYAQIGDLSEGGLSLRTPARLTPGSPVRVWLPAAAGAVEVEARVAWCLERDRPGAGAGAGMGLRFEGAGPGAAEALRGLVGSLRRARS